MTPLTTCHQPLFLPVPASFSYRLLSAMSAFLIAFLLTGCGSTDRPGSTAAETLTCTPDTLRAGDTLHVQLSAPPRHLALADPSGTAFYAVVHGSTHPMLSPPISVPMDVEHPHLALPTDSLQMKPVAYDARIAIPVFRRKGRYRLYLRPAGEVTDTTPAGCTVAYLGAGDE